MTVAEDVPLRLSDAAQIAFPYGGMTEAGLRREAKRGRLQIERIAGKDFVTLAAIREMREQCHVRKNQPASGSVPSVSTKTAQFAQKRRGSSSTAGSKSRHDAFVEKLQRLNAS